MRRWERLSGPVWQRFDGLRVHVGGLLVRRPGAHVDFIGTKGPMWLDCKRREPRRLRALLLYADRVYPMREAS